MKLVKKIRGKIKKYNDRYFILIALRNQSRRARRDNSVFKMKKRRGENNKLCRYGSSISRSKSRIRELALCNEWKRFLTVTLDGSHDRTDFSAFKGSLLSKLKRCKTRDNIEIKYLAVFSSQ